MTRMDYTPLLNAGLSQSATLTWSHGHDIEHAAAAYGATESGDWMTLGEFRDEYDETGEYVLLSTRHEWVVGYEPSGWQGSRPEVVEVLSASGRALGVFWNVNLDTSLTYAQQGQTLVAIDPLSPEDRTGWRPNTLDADLIDVGIINVGFSDVRSALLALGERLSGAPLSLQWLEGAFYAVRITDPVNQAIIPLAYLNPRAAFLDEPAFTALLSVEPGPTLAEPILAQVTAVLNSLSEDSPTVAQAMEDVRHTDHLIAAHLVIDRLQNARTLEPDDRRKLIVLRGLVNRILGR